MRQFVRTRKQTERFLGHGDDARCPAALPTVGEHVRDGVPVITDGPYLEAKEFLGGYYLVDVASRDRALELAALIPDARFDGLGIEVRQVIFSGGPSA